MQRLKGFLSYLQRWHKAIILGIVIGWFVSYVYTIESIVKDCKVMGSFRLHYTAISCYVGPKITWEKK